MLDKLETQPVDPILSLTDLAREDPRPHKLNLGVGIYVDDGGNTPIMAAVKTAERELIETQDSKAYLGARGDVRFVELLRDLVFGERLSADLGERVQGFQTAGGVGALRIGTELLVRAECPALIVGSPSWPIHAPIVAAAGMGVVWARHFDPVTHGVDFNAIAEALNRANPGDAALFHASCHNPTGADFSTGQWSELTRILVDRNIIPFIDAAYLGLGDGIDQDADGLRTMLKAIPSALVAVSCSKSFGLYRERVGALFIIGSTPEQAQIAMSNATAIARTLYSLPPDHGAAVARLVLERKELRSIWHAELAHMRKRLHMIRKDFGTRAVKAGLPLHAVAHQRGMFCLLPIEPAQVHRMRTERAIYMPESGRINLAALPLERSQYVVDAIMEAQQTR